MNRQTNASAKSKELLKPNADSVGTDLFLTFHTIKFGTLVI
jgi:hypothetical protein